MLKRFLSVLLCAALICAVLPTAMAAKEDDYTLPELLYQHFVVQDYPIRGSMALTASGTASWLDMLLPYTATTLHLRLLNLENSDDFQYQVYVEDAQGDQKALTQLYRADDALYLRSELLPDTLLTLPVGGDVLGTLLGKTEQGNDSFYSVVLGIINQPDMIWDNVWTPVLEDYLNDIELWLADYASDPVMTGDTGDMVMQISYVIPAQDVKEQAKALWHNVLFDEELLTLLRPLMTQQQQNIYLNSGMTYFYDYCIDALPLTGELRLSRTLTTRGDVKAVSVALPMPENAWGFTNLTFRQDASGLTLMLLNDERTLTLTAAQSSGEDENGQWTGTFSSVPAAAQEEKLVQVNYVLSHTHTTSLDSDGKRHDDTAWTLALTPEAENAENEQYLAFEPIEMSLTMAYSRENKDSAPVRLNVSAALHMSEADVSLKLAVRTTNRWNALTLPTTGAENVLTITPQRSATLLLTAMNNAIRTMTSLSPAAESTQEEQVTTDSNLPALEEVSEDDAA